MTGPGPEPPYDTLPPDAPATVEDVRASRRWTLVALVWAIAASAIAVIALVTNTSDDGNTQTQTTPDLAPRIDKLEQNTNDRLDAFSRRLSDRAADSDVQKLEKRLANAEDDASEAKNDSRDNADAIEQLQQDMQDLQQRVDDLEAQQEQQQAQDQQQTP